MNTATKLSAYGVALALVAGSAWAIGTAVGPFAGPAGAHDAEDVGHGDTHSGTVAEAEQDQPGGLASSRGGYTLTPTRTTLEPATSHPFSFRILGTAAGRAGTFHAEVPARTGEFTLAASGTQQGPAQEGATR